MNRAQAVRIATHWVGLTKPNEFDRQLGVAAVIQREVSALLRAFPDDAAPAKPAVEADAVPEWAREVARDFEFACGDSVIPLATLLAKTRDDAIMECARECANADDLNAGSDPTHWTTCRYAILSLRGLAPRG